MFAARIARLATAAGLVGLASLVGVDTVSAACTSTSPTVITDKSEYGRSDTVTISGCGFGDSEPLLVLVKGPDGRARSVDATGRPGPYEVTADQSGAFDLLHALPGARQGLGMLAKRGMYRGDYGRYMVVVMSTAGLPLASTVFDRTPDTYATCAPETTTRGTTCWGNSTSSPDFFWLPPTVPTAATPTGPFDGAALDDLVVEICALNEAEECADGPPVARFTSTARPFQSRITLNTPGQFYTVDWQALPFRVSRELTYRVNVFQADEAVGSIDVSFTQHALQLASVDARRHLGALWGQRLTIRFRIQEPTARTRVTINEVESSGGVPGDWVELHNSASVPLSLAGYLVKDNDDTHVSTLPDGAMIPASGYYVVEESQLGFGLGGGDAVRLFTPDGTVLFDSYAWTAHAVTTYGRCPDGFGAFQTNTTVTKEAANDCSVVIRINEIESSGGTPGSWVELYNPGPGPANLDGFVLTDAGATLPSYALPAIVVPAGGYLVLEEANFVFGLDGADAVRLFRPDGSIADSHAWLTHAATTYGRCPNGSGAIVTTLGPTKGSANSCFVPATTLRINEVESSGGAPGDWIELVNIGATPIDLSGWRVLDNDDTHVPYVLPAGTTIAAGGYLVVEEAGLGFGLGATDSARVYDPIGGLYEAYSWTAHATTTYGRCPNGTGAFATTTASTKGAVNACVGSVTAVRINEVESSGGVPGDWVELFNPTAAPVDISNLIFRDNDDTHTYAIPAGTTIAAGGYYVIEEAALGFGLGGADSARMFDAIGTLLDSYSWTAHATTTYGRCPNGTGAFITTTGSTQGALNTCPGDPSAWPGDAAVQTIDGLSVFGGNLSGLAYEGSGSATPGVLWAARNGPGSLFRLVWNGTIWTPDATNSWNVGKTLAYPDGTGSPDAEGVTFPDAGSLDGLYVATERDNNANAVSRNSILRFDVTAASGATLGATHEWNLTADLPVGGANLGIEAITWIPDSFLVAQGFFDESTGSTYAPANYPNHGTGLFFVGVEANGTIYAYALNHATSAFVRIATVTTGLAGVMDLQFDRETNDLWAVCDDT